VQAAELSASNSSFTEGVAVLFPVTMATTTTLLVLLMAAASSIAFYPSKRTARSENGN
jgi:hypothetical protein